LPTFSEVLESGLGKVVCQRELLEVHRSRAILYGRSNKQDSIDPRQVLEDLLASLVLKYLNAGRMKRLRWYFGRVVVALGFG
jgi:hypothetical protein